MSASGVGGSSGTPGAYRWPVDTLDAPDAPAGVLLTRSQIWWLTGSMSSCPTLTTKRLVMRPFRDDDLEPFFVAMSAVEVRASLHLSDDYTMSAAWGSMLSFAGMWELKGLGQWALEERSTGRFLGRAGLHWRPDDDWPGVEVGWMLDPTAWGSGYAVEAGARAVRYGFEVLGAEALVSLILKENTRSQSVAKRLGYKPGIERTMSFYPDSPHVVWRLDRAGWEARPTAS
jgi:ribosomal-protein-alanine N-acetyltransferase